MGFQWCYVAGSGVDWDLRAELPYEVYNALDFQFLQEFMGIVMIGFYYGWKKCDKVYV